MDTLRKLIELGESGRPNLTKEIASLLNSESHSLVQINQILYLLLLAEKYEMASVLANMLHSQGQQSHAVSFSQVFAAAALEYNELQHELVKALQSQYASIWPRPRKKLMETFIRPLARKIHAAKLLKSSASAAQFQWLLNVTHPDFHTGAYESPCFAELTGQHTLVAKIVDVGASDIGWPPPYHSMLRDGANLIGFEPSEAAHNKLTANAKPNQTYLKAALGDGSTKTLNFFWDPGMTSCLLPNKPVLDMFFPYACEVKASEQIDTIKLDDVEEIDDVDLLKMDIQGLELEVLRNATSKLSKTLVIDIEVSFVEMYQGQPLFADIALFLRQQGFQFHRFNYDADPALEGEEIQTVGPGWMASGTGLISNNRGQALWADAIFVRDYTQLEELSDKQLLSMARVLHDCYQSYGIVQHLLSEYDSRLNTSLLPCYVTGSRLH